jgi:predicted extracellular nuclease
MLRVVSVVLVGLLSLPWMGAAVASSGGCDRPRLNVPVAVRGPVADEISVATQNLWRLFDDVADGGQVLSADLYDLKRAKLSRQIVDVLRMPDVVAVQEVENQKVLAALASDIAARSSRPTYRAVVLEGSDPGGIDVGFLIRPDWKLLSVSQLMVALSLEGKPLFDRPPLHIVVQDHTGQRLELINVHLKSLKGSEHPSKAKRIAVKRRQQAEALTKWWRQYQQAHPSVVLVMLGDFNATPEVLGGVDVLGYLSAQGLRSASVHMPANERYSYVFQCRPELIDNILLSSGGFGRISGMVASRGNAEASKRAKKSTQTAAGSSDHDALVVFIRRP